MGIPYEFQAERFSRWMAYVLRHNPTRYGLQPDRHGYVDLELFIQIAQHRYPHVPVEQLRAVVTDSNAQRFEIIGDRMRARYGHSIPVEPTSQPIAPPEQLYYGTDAAYAQTSLKQGLRPSDRRFLHLSDTLEDALAVARHKTEQPSVLSIQATAAHQAGIPFYREGKVYLAPHIPAQWLSLRPIPTAQASGASSSAVDVT